MAVRRAERNVTSGTHIASTHGRFMRRGPQVNDIANHGSLVGLKVMVIDDSKTIRRTAETLLKKEGAEVLTAVDGFEALSKISDLKPDIIFVDIMMPRLDRSEERRVGKECRAG